MIRAALIWLLLAQAQPPDYRGSYTVPLNEAALGHMLAVWRALNIPVSLRGLVISQTSFKVSLIGPAAP